MKVLNGFEDACEREFCFLLVEWAGPLHEGGVPGEPAEGVEARRQAAGAGEGDPSLRRADAVQPAETRGNPHGSPVSVPMSSSISVAL